MVETVVLEGFGLLIATATLLGFIARKTGQPTVIAYITTGLILGPIGFSLLQETQMTKLFSELGLVFLLFLIGLEIRIDEVKDILKPTVFIGVSQMALTSLVGFLIGITLGFTLFESVFIAAASTFSSTALVVKMLAEKGGGTSLPERLDIGILLIQDIAVVLLLALLTVQASAPFAIGLRIAEIALLIGLIGFISVLSSQYFLPKLFKRISENKHAFFIHGIAWAFLFISLAQQLNLSMEIGAFFAGLSLAQLPYSRELQERVRPLTDLFMAVFFINFGLNLLPGNFTVYLVEAIVASTVLILAKFTVIFSLADMSSFTPESSFKSAINMTQNSEFSLVLAGLAVSEGIISQQLTGFISLVAIITMGISSYLIRYNNQVYSFFKPYLKRFESEKKSDVEIEVAEDHAIIVGYDDISRRVVPELENYFDQIIIVDRNPENIKELSSSDHKFIYGDFSHGKIMKSAGIKEAKFVLSLAPEPDVNKEILEYTGKKPTLFVKADGMEEAGELYDMGAHYVIIRNVLTGEKMSDYIKLYLEDRDLFKKEIRPEIDRIIYGDIDE